jgi:HEAT repeat protein
MTRKRIVLLLALAAVVAGVVIWWPRGPKEPEYRGYGITYYLKRSVTENTSEASSAAGVAVRATSAETMRFLMSEFARRDPPWVDSINSLLHDKLASRLHIPGEQDRVNLVDEGLYLLKGEIAPILPELAAYLPQIDRGHLAAIFMSGAGAPAIPYYMKELDSTNLLVAENARYGIIRVSAETDAILPTLQQWLGHTNAELRDVAVQGLGFSRSPTNWIVPALINALDDPHPQVREHAISSLRRKRGAAKPAIPSLLRLMTNTNPSIAKSASNLIVRLDPAALPPPTK